MESCWGWVELRNEWFNQNFLFQLIILVEAITYGMERRDYLELLRFRSSSSNEYFHSADSELSKPISKRSEMLLEDWESCNCPQRDVSIQYQGKHIEKSIVVSHIFSLLSTISTFLIHLWGEYHLINRIESLYIITLISVFQSTLVRWIRKNYRWDREQRPN